MLRFTLPAAAALRREIALADGNEVFAIGDVEPGPPGQKPIVVRVEVVCRGQADRVNALLERPAAGQVVVHNHPSGNLTPSDADMQLAGLYGDNGVGFVIVDSDVTRSNWAVEPHAPREVPVDETAIDAFFFESLKEAMPDFEPRPGQLEMAHGVARALNERRPYVVEAGTGTGKSLAYLVPAALWAIANKSKVVVSTHTKALQAQLLTSDLPMLTKGGLEASYAVLQGRANYVCKRRLALADEEDKVFPKDMRAELDALLDWEKTSADGSRGDVPMSLDPVLWERVESDADLTLRVRCQHYETCHFYTARRRAAAAHVVVVNHALLLADLALRDAGAPGVLPSYDRVVLDEAHHLEDAATGAVTRRLTARMLFRATAPVLSTKKRRGALDRLLDKGLAPNGPLGTEARERLVAAAESARDQLKRARDEGRAALALLAYDALDPDGNPLRITEEVEATDKWKDLIAPRIGQVAILAEDAAGALDAVCAPFEDVAVPDSDAQPLMDVQRARRRLAEQAETARSFLAQDDDICRWLEAERTRDGVEATPNLAPIEVAPLLRRLLWDRHPGTAATSATLAVGQRFDFWLKRSGLPVADPHEERSEVKLQVATGIVPSPFDHAKQAILALPRDLPEPDDPAFLDETARVVLEAVRISDGGAFVLCTSYRAVDHYGAVLRDALPPEQPVLTQGNAGRTQLLDRFKDNRRAVLVGTDSFWEGVSVKGDGLRLVVIPRLPFRVPTEPLRIARLERIARRGGDPFRAYSLPEAVIKLRQGYGRLIRHRGDRGVVLLLDRRIHDRSYGSLMLNSLPPARRISAPWARVADELRAFYRGTATEAPAAGNVSAFLARLRERQEETG